MNDLISRQAAIDAVKWGITYARAINTCTGETKELFKVSNHALNEAVERLKELPSAQPEIIHCGDCKYYTPVTAHCEIRGKGLYLIRGMEDFCSRAERRIDESD